MRMPMVVASRNAEIAAWASLSAAALYAALAGFTVPTQRAMIMLAVAQLALVSRRSVSMSSGLSAAVLLVLAWDPAAPLSASFWLSFVAVALLWQLARSEYSRGGKRDPLGPVGGIRASRGGAARPVWRIEWYIGRTNTREYPQSFRVVSVSCVVFAHEFVAERAVHPAKRHLPLLVMPKGA